MQNQKIRKVLVISHEYPPVGGGGGKVIQDLCEGLHKNGIAFHILTSLWKELPEFDILDGFTIERIRSRRKEAFRASMDSMISFVWKSFWRALRVIKTWNPDLIHAHFAVPGGASAALAGILTRTPYILTIHGGDVPGGAPEKTERWFRFIKPFTGYIWKNASAVITVSQFSRQLAEAQYPVKIEVVPNGIDTTKYKQANQKVNEPVEILFIGRFSPEKNAVAVPAILNRIKDYPWHCTMIGNGPQFKTVRENISQLGLGEKFTLTGWLDQEDVDSHLLSSDILLMPSLREGMPMAGLQALASGNALILSKVGACEEMVDIGKNGELLNPDNIIGFSEAVANLITSHDKLRSFKKNSKQKSSQFDLDQVIKKYQDKYTEIIKGKNS